MTIGWGNAKDVGRTKFMKTEAGRIEERFYGVSYLLLCAEKDRQKGGNRV